MQMKCFILDQYQQVCHCCRCTTWSCMLLFAHFFFQWAAILLVRFENSTTFIIKAIHLNWLCTAFIKKCSTIHLKIKPSLYTASQNAFTSEAKYTMNPEQRHPLYSRQPSHLKSWFIDNKPMTKVTPVHNQKTSFPHPASLALRRCWSGLKATGMKLNIIARCEECSGNRGAAG